jgi:hypothetical protein
MKKFFLFAFLCVGCAGTEAVAVKPAAPPPCPAVAPAPLCTDKLVSLSEEELRTGFTCPGNTRLVFPSSYIRSEKLLVMCQCRQ